MHPPPHESPFSRSREKGRDEGPRPARTPLQASIRALARREFTRLELERRLRREFPDGESAAAIPPTLDRLEREGLLSDARMARSFVRVHAGRYGRARLAAELERRGVPDEAISAVLPTASDDERAAADLWRRRFGTPAPDARGKARQARFLAARGFSTDTIRRLILR